MRRLREGQEVWLCAARRDGPARACAVVATYRSSAALRALGGPLGDRGGAPTGYYLVFEHGGRPVALLGQVEIDGEDLRFNATDGVLLSQTSAPIVTTNLPIELVAVDRPYAEPVQGVTASWSADGVLLADAGDLHPGEPVRFTFSPGSDLQVTGRGEVLAIEGERLGVAFLGLEPAMRRRLIDYVIELKRSGGASRPASASASAA